MDASRVSSRLPQIRPVGLARKRQRRRARLLLLSDALALGFAVAASSWSSSIGGTTGQPVLWSAVAVVLTLVMLAARGGYRFRLEVSPFDHIGQVIIASALAMSTTVALRVVLDSAPSVATEAVRLWGFTVVYLVAARVARATVDRRPGRHGARTLVIGAGQVGQLVARRLRERPDLGLQPVGFLDKDPRVLPEDLAGIDVFGASWDLEAVAREHDIEHVIVTFSTAPHHVLLDLVRRCRAMGLQVSLVPRLFEQISNRVSVDHLGGVALLRVEQADPKGWQFELKYAADRVLAALLVVAVSPVLASLALLVRLSSPGPILFRQARVGMDGHEFDLLKFRTMRVDEGTGEHDARWAAATLGLADEATGDPDDVVDRRTPIGRLLRRWSLDELPQLLNILRGDMSFVGPRPERVGYVRAFEQHVYRYGDRHRVKSGLTGWAQVQGLRGETSLTDRIEWDNYYVENWSPWLDLKIFLLTFPAVLNHRGVE